MMPSIQFLLKKILWGIGITLLFISAVSVDAIAKQRRYDYDLLSVDFPTVNTGWVCGRHGIILYTGNKGKTWARQETGTDQTLTSIVFMNENEGWAVGNQGTILHTSNGGKGWYPQQSPVPYYLMDVCFISLKKGWIVTERTHILHTDDGGETWEVQFSDEDYILKAISFSDENNGWVVGEYGYIYRTRDGGYTWEKQAGYFDISETTGEMMGGNFLFDIMCIDANTAWAVGIDGYIIKTEDGGKVWREIPVNAPKTQLFCVDFNGENKIVIGGNGVFLSSFDGGKNWQVTDFNPPIEHGWIYGLSHVKESLFAAVGWNGAIYLNTAKAWNRMN